MALSAVKSRKGHAKWIKLLLEKEDDKTSQIESDWTLMDIWIDGGTSQGFRANVKEIVRKYIGTWNLTCMEYWLIFRYRKMLKERTIFTQPIILVSWGNFAPLTSIATARMSRKYVFSTSRHTINSMYYQYTCIVGGFRSRKREDRVFGRIFLINIKSDNKRNLLRFNLLVNVRMLSTDRIWIM